MTSARDSIELIKNDTIEVKSLSQAELVQQLLYQIVRVKELVKYYDSIPNGAGQLGSAILTELVSEAHGSLIDYDTPLMQKYYDLLLNCD
jgi:hypothetical protein